MKAKPVVPREAALRDVDEALTWYLQAASPSVALAFIDALARACTHIGRHPATGSPRYAHELNLPGLRFWAFGRKPHRVFYVEHNDHVDVWHVLSSERDLPAWLRDMPETPGAEPAA